MYDYPDDNRNNRSALLQTGGRSISVDIKQYQRKRHCKQKLIQTDTAFEFHGQAIVGTKKIKKTKCLFFKELKYPPLYAALDLGTNNCRLLIASPSKPGHFRVVDAFSRIVRLGEGLVKNGS